MPFGRIVGLMGLVYESVTYIPTDGRTDGRTHILIEMRGRILKLQSDPAKKHSLIGEFRQCILSQSIMRVETLESEWNRRKEKRGRDWQREKHAVT